MWMMIFICFSEAHVGAQEKLIKSQVGHPSFCVFISSTSSLLLLLFMKLICVHVNLITFGIFITHATALYLHVLVWN